MNDEIKKLLPERRPTPQASPLYLLAQVAAAVLTLNVTLPLILHVSWNGSLVQQAGFLLFFGIAMMVMTTVFLGLAGYLGIMFVVAKNLKKFRMEDIDNKAVARAIAIHVLKGSQPRWLISLTPCVVPAISFAMSVLFVGQHHIQLVDSMQILLACLLQGLTSFIFCLPIIIRTQKNFDATALLERQ